MMPSKLTPLLLTFPLLPSIMTGDESTKGQDHIFLPELRQPIPQMGGTLSRLRPVELHGGRDLLLCPDCPAEGHEGG